MDSLGLSELKEILSSTEKSLDRIIIDVRTKEERDQLALAGTDHIPLDELPSSLNTLKDYKEIILHCAHGVRCKRGAKWLEEQGFTAVKYVLADIEQWQASGLPCVSKPTLKE